LDYDTFIAAVTKRVPVSSDQAEAITAGTLRTLAQRIDDGQARQLASQLPAELREFLFVPRVSAESFAPADFVLRVSTRAGVSLRMATDGTRAVLNTVREAVPPAAFDDALSQLPRAYWDSAESLISPVEVQQNRMR
jgi:uncharacterized protein (DUF2267 family)